MKFISYFAIAAAAVFGACQTGPAPENDSLDTGFRETPLVTDTKPDSLLYMDTSVMVVDSMSNITFDGMPVVGERDNIQRAVYNSWLKAYERTNHLPLRFTLVQQGTVMMGIRGNIGDAVLKAQDDLKNYIARDKYSKPFTQLAQNVKDSLQRLHPVLFQRPF